jgi:hypothetical protein
MTDKTPFFVFKKNETVGKFLKRCSSVKNNFYKDFEINECLKKREAEGIKSI